MGQMTRQTETKHTTEMAEWPNDGQTNRQKEYPQKSHESFFPLSS